MPLTPTTVPDPVRAYLDAVRAHGRDVQEPNEAGHAAAEAIDHAREAALAADAPPLLLRVVQAQRLDLTAIRVLETLVAAVVAGEDGLRLGELNPGVDDRDVVLEALKLLRDLGLVQREPVVDRTRPLPPWTMEPATAAALLNADPREAVLTATGLDVLLAGSAPFDAGEAGIGAGPFADDLDVFEAASALAQLWDERYDARRGTSVRGASVSGSRSLDRAERAESRLRQAQAAFAVRFEATRASGGRLPRVAALSERLGLSEFERDVLLYLCCAHVQSGVRRHGSSPDVEDLIDFLAPGFRGAVAARRAFYRDAPLVREGILEVEVRHGSLNQARVTLDPHTVDWLVGLDSESGAVRDGTHLFTPAVALADVHLPDAEKARVVEAAGDDAAFRRARTDLGLDDQLAYGRGLVFLFHGPPGTGKTMMAHALAGHLGKRLLLVNSGPSVFERDDAVFRSLLREARLADAVLFFDEAESFFGGHVPALLTEIERHDGIVVLATNRPEAIDAAMRRRCTVSVRFDEPGAALRRKIWDGLLPASALDPDVDTQALAERFALPGGYVKNAVLTAVAGAASRAEASGVPVRLAQADLVAAAVAQVRSRIAGNGVGAIVPRGGLDRLVFEPRVAEALAGVAALERERPAVLRAWGFGSGPTGRGQAAESGGLYGASTAVLLEGPPGTGKTAAAEALAFDLGRPLHVVTAADVLDRYVGETAKRLREAFEAARASGAVLVLDEADALLEARGGGGTATDRYANADVSVLLGLLERHDGLVVLTTNRAAALDPALARRLWLRLTLGRPGLAERRRLWGGALPEACPRDADVDLERLAATWEATGAEIERAVYRAAAAAAVAGRTLQQRDLEAAVEAEESREAIRPIGFATAA